VDLFHAPLDPTADVGGLDFPSPNAEYVALLDADRRPVPSIPAGALFNGPSRRHDNEPGTRNLEGTRAPGSSTERNPM
jgi:hypothetical protein